MRKCRGLFAGSLGLRVCGFAQVGEWLKPTDCKSVPPSEVRRFESFPVHHFEAAVEYSKEVRPLTGWIFGPGNIELADVVERSHDRPRDGIGV